MITQGIRLAALAGLAAAWFAAPALAQKQTIKMAHWTGPAHHMVQTLAAWGELIAKESGGNLVLEVDKAPLAKPPGQYDLVKNGIRDLAWPVPAYTKGRFELMQVGELPFICPNATACAQATTSWYIRHGFDEKEFEDGRTKFLLAYNHGPGTVHSTVELTNLEQIKGVKMRAGGAGVPIAKALGMSVVAMSATEVHEALQRGTVDGVLFPWEAVESFRLTELVKNHLEIPGGMYSATFFHPINTKAFESLTEANKAALLRASGVAGARLMGEHWDAADKAARAKAVERGNTIHTLSAEERKRWLPLLDFVRKEWVDMADAKGLNGEMLLADFRAEVEKFSK